METVFEKAVMSYGRDYLDAEQTLRDGGPAALSVLQENLQHIDPVARLMVSCLLRWMEGRAPEFQAALDYLDYIPKKLAQTPVGAPRAVGVANDLSERFGAAAVDIVALRLAKDSDWPRWKVLGVVFYLSVRPERS